MFKRFLCAFCLFLFLSGPALFAADTPEQSSISAVSADQLQNILNDNLKAGASFGDPINVNGLTIIPVVARGLAFGIGNNLKTEEAKNSVGKPGEKNKFVEGEKSFCGGIGFVRPISLIIITKDGEIRVQSLQMSFLVDLAEKVFPYIKDIVEKRMEMFQMRMHNPPPPPPAKPPLK
ncbi:MAG: hypothetical protein HQM10_06680 [Candidatus Riflebacteria bacterium]|nr:hypothetical protein [Candidatus Riflebacteria bacterium]